MTTVKTRKKLIEVALPLEAINKESLLRKQKAPKGWPMSFHKYWAQRPLAAARAIIFAQMVDDPSAYPDVFQTEEAQFKRREYLFGLIKELCMWDNTWDSNLVRTVQAEIKASWEVFCEDNSNHPLAKEHFQKDALPGFWDPFGGSGAIPMSAQWMGLDSVGSDLNPVAVVLNKAMMELPWAFKGKKAVNPDAKILIKEAEAAMGMASDVKYYARILRKISLGGIHRHYPDYEVTDDVITQHPELAAHKGQKLTIVAWIWARAVKSPNPACAEIDVPLCSSFLLSSKSGKEAFITPSLINGRYRYTVKCGPGHDAESVRLGTSAGRRAAFKCLASGVPISYDYIREQGAAGRLSQVLMAVVVDGPNGRIFLDPREIDEFSAKSATPRWRPETLMQGKCRVNVSNYGINTFGDLFTERQLLAHTTFVDSIEEVRKIIEQDALQSGVSNDSTALSDGGRGALAYSQAIATYLACIVDRMVYYGSTLSTWLPKDNAIRDCMPRQALAMTWDFTEANPFGKSSGDILTCANSVANYLEVATPNAAGRGAQCDAQTGIPDKSLRLISTDPPYYDNISYADLADFFYAWMRPMLKGIYPGLFSTLATPKIEELVADSARHGGPARAEHFFIEGMTSAMRSISAKSHPAFPITIYYAFKQSEGDEDGTASTGWETFLGAIINAGLSIEGTWPLKTEGAGRMIASGTNALSSSIVLVCRKRVSAAPPITKREFMQNLRQAMPGAISALLEASLAPVDLAQAAIGPGMAIYTSYTKVVGLDGAPLTVREALMTINQVLDEQLAEQEGNWDADTRWAVVWFEQFAFGAGEFGQADQLARAKNTSVLGVVEAGITSSSAGKVRLLKPDELPVGWSPETDNRLTVWEVLHHLIRLQKQGEVLAASMLARVGEKAEPAKELAYRLYGICERKKRSTEGQLYNDLIAVWPDLVNQSKQAPAPTARSGEFELDA